MSPSLIPLLSLSPLLVLMAASDLAHLRIPNRLVLLGCAVFLATAPFVGFGELGLRILVAGIVFVIGFAGFALRLLGGGDVKMLAMLMLVVPTHSLTVFSFVFSAAMLACILVIVLMRRVPQLRRSGLVSMQADGRLPMGVPIAVAGIGQLALLSYLP